MRKTLIVMLAALALIATACGDDDDGTDAPSGAQTYDVDIDADADPQFQISTYFPAKLTVRPGDTINFRSASKAHPHTVTLGIKADQSNRPALITPQGENPVAFGPCFTDTEPSTQLAACPTPDPNPASPPAFAGKGYWSSGILSKAAGPTTPANITLKLDAATPPGDYTFLCMLHPFMTGVLTVADDDGDRQAPTAVRADAEAAAARAIEATADVKPRAATPGNVTAGWGDNITAVNLFDPQAITIKAGETVTWTATSPYEPHTVTFESKFTSPGDPAVSMPAGVKSGGTYTGGFTSSGFFGPEPFFPGNTFSLKFSRAGTYQYVCAIHPPMTGTVTVT